ncbi:proheparin-binding EGF-like growth factor isoform X2 [Myotis myotis]|uniref:proheparin-binding EGF-like growth factor isoform X2 n=1 Tax=Myotis myotis TaxID=51298 RepID=UPI001749814A|nr:proheparin-binding EGF-like growth factor isoform X2 [Myotis myotis]
MKLLPSVVLKLFLAAVLSALVTGESLERLRRGLAGGTSNLGSPTDSTDQLLPPGGVRGREVLDLEGADLDLFRALPLGAVSALSKSRVCCKAEPGLPLFILSQWTFLVTPECSWPSPPRLAPFSSKPQALATPGKDERGKRKKKGKKGLGKKRDPCLRKYKDFCIHGECKYVKELRAPSCICHLGYHGERCHGLSLPVENRLSTYDHTTILAVVAVVLSSVCLLVIVGLLMFRYHRRGGYDVENEEKVKLGMTTSH